jgi:hypothetical protein
MDSKGNTCDDNERNIGHSLHWGGPRKKRNKTIQQDAAIKKVDTDRRNSIVDAVTVEVYTRLFGAN